MKNIPKLLIILRFLLGPFMIYLSYLYGVQIRSELVILLFIGLLTDILDGVVARKYNVSSEKLRRMDSQTDLFFWMCVSWCLWVLSPEIILTHKSSISMIILMEVLTYAFSIAKFGKETCTHAILSKIWGITLLIAFVSMIGFNYAGIPFYMAVIFGFIGHIDVYLIIYFLPRWTHDVPSCYHAYLIKKELPIVRNKWFNG